MDTFKSSATLASQSFESELQQILALAPTEIASRKAQFSVSNSPLNDTHIAAGSYTAYSFGSNPYPFDSSQLFQESGVDGLLSQSLFGDGRVYGTIDEQLAALAVGSTTTHSSSADSLTMSSLTFPRSNLSPTTVSTIDMTLPPVGSLDFLPPPLAAPRVIGPISTSYPISTSVVGSNQNQRYTLPAAIDNAALGYAATTQMSMSACFPLTSMPAALSGKRVIGDAGTRTGDAVLALAPLNTVPFSSASVATTAFGLADNTRVSSSLPSFVSSSDAYSLAFQPYPITNANSLIAQPFPNFASTDSSAGTMFPASTPSSALSSLSALLGTDLSSMTTTTGNSTFSIPTNQTQSQIQRPPMGYGAFLAGLQAPQLQSVSALPEISQMHSSGIAITNNAAITNIASTISSNGMLPSTTSTIPVADFTALYRPNRGRVTNTALVTVPPSTTNVWPPVALPVAAVSVINPLSVSVVPSPEVEFQRNPSQVLGFSDPMSTVVSIPSVMAVAENPIAATNQGVAEVLLLDWSSVNAVLQRNGFPLVLVDAQARPLQSTPTIVHWASLLHTLGQVLEDYECKRDRVLADEGARAQRHHELQEAEQQRDQLQSGLKQQQDAVDRLQRQNNEFSLRQSQHQQQLSAAERQTEQRQADARRQLTQQQHQTRVGERECEQLRVKMQKIVDKAERRRLSDQNVFRELTGRQARPASTRDSHTLEAISAFEAQRHQQQKEIEFLRRELITVNALLAEGNNRHMEPQRHRFSSASISTATRNGNVHVHNDETSTPPQYSLHSQQSHQSPDSSTVLSESSLAQSSSTRLTDSYQEDSYHRERDGQRGGHSLSPIGLQRPRGASKQRISENGRDLNRNHHFDSLKPTRRTLSNGPQSQHRNGINGGRSVSSQPRRHRVDGSHDDPWRLVESDDERVELMQRAEHVEQAERERRVQAEVQPLIEAERRLRQASERELVDLRSQADAVIQQKLVELQQAAAKSQTLEEELINLKLELESRPSARDWKSAKNEIFKLQRMLSEAKSVSELRKYMDTRELIRRDKDVHELQLNRIEHLPRQICTELLQDVCRELALTDVAMAVPAIHKMSRVVAAVPGMEKFIRDICNVALSVEAPPEYASVVSAPTTSPLDRVLPTLQRWLVELRELHSLRRLRQDLEQSIRQRGPVAIGGGGAGDASTTSHVELLQAVRELVASEQASRVTRQTYDTAQQHINAQPEALVSKIISHFQHLFDVKNVDGIFPKMTEIYLSLNEMNNILKVLRSTMSLDPAASINTILSALRQLVDDDTGSSAIVSSAGKLVAKTSVGDNSGDGTALNARQIERQQNQLSGELKRFFDVEQLSAVMPLCVRLVNRVKTYDEVFPALDMLVSQLYNMLHINNIDSIVPSVHALLQQVQSKTQASFAAPQISQPRYPQQQDVTRQAYQNSDGGRSFGTVPDIRVPFVPFVGDANSSQPVYFQSPPPPPSQNQSYLNDTVNAGSQESISLSQFAVATSVPRGAATDSRQSGPIHNITNNGVTSAMHEYEQMLLPIADSGRNLSGKQYVDNSAIQPQSRAATTATSYGTSDYQQDLSTGAYVSPYQTSYAHGVDMQEGTLMQGFV